MMRVALVLAAGLLLAGPIAADPGETGAALEGGRPLVMRPRLRPDNTQPFYMEWADDSSEGSGTNYGLNVFVDEKNTGGTAGFFGILGHAAFDGTESPGRPYVGVEGLGVRGPRGTGGPAKTPAVWGMIADSIDFTNTRSSRTNSQLALEADLEVNDVDDADQRQGIVVVLAKHDPKGIAPQAGYGLNITQQSPPGTRNFDSYKRVIAVEGNYDVAALDLRKAFKDGGSSGQVAHVIDVNEQEGTLHVSDVLPFTTDALGNDVDQGSGRVGSILIDDVPYEVTHYSISGTGPEGYLTVAPDARGRVKRGGVIEGNAHTVWLPQNGDIAFDYGRAGRPVVRVYGDGSRLRVSGGLAVDGDAAVQGPLTLASYDFAKLPRADKAARVVFCVDCRKPGEAAGRGTGMAVFDDGHGRWVSMGGSVAAR